MRDGAERRAHPDFISLGSFGNMLPVHSSACKYRWDRKGSDWELQECMEENVPLHLENFDISSGVMCKNAKYESQKQISQVFFFAVVFIHCGYFQLGWRFLDLCSRGRCLSTKNVKVWELPFYCHVVNYNIVFLKQIWGEWCCT